MELPIRERRRREKEKIRIFHIHMCARTLITTVTIATLMVTQKKNVGNYIKVES
jgi:hypothetical protein